MATKSLLKSSYQKRGSSRRKWYDRKRTRARAKQALHRATINEDWELALDEGASMGPDHRDKGPDTRFLERFLMKFVGKPVKEVAGELRARVGRGYKAERLLQELEDLYEDIDNHGGIWVNSSSICGGETFVLFVNEEGILCRQDWCEPHGSHLATYREPVPEPARPAKGWLTSEEIRQWRDHREVIDRNGSFYWVSYKFGRRTEKAWVGFDEETGENIFEDREVYVDMGRRQVPFSKHDQKMWNRTHPWDRGQMKAWIH